MSTFRLFLPVMLAAIVLGAIWVLDLTRQLGAHPFWSGDVIWIGGGLGLLAGFATARFAVLPRLVAFAALLVAAFVLARYGKAAFAASFAEDQFAGRLWFWGWHATMAGLGALLVTLAAAALGRADR